MAHPPPEVTDSPASVRRSFSPLALPPHWHLIWVAVVALVLFAQSVSYPFLYDDTRYVEQNVQLRRLSSVVTGFFTTFPAHLPDLGQYRPLLTSTLTLDHALAGPVLDINPGTGSALIPSWPFHATNIVIHALASLLVALLAWELAARAGGRRFTIAMATGLLFAVHPVHVEAVANVTGRAESQMAMFYLAGLYCLWRHPLGQPLFTSPWMLGSVVCAAASVFTKESGVTFPLMAALLLWLKPALAPADPSAPNPAPTAKPPALARRLLLLLPFIAVLALYAAARLWVVGQLGPAARTLYFEGFPDHAPGPTMATVFVLYHKLLFIPTHFNPDWEFPLYFFHRFPVEAPSSWAAAPALLGLGLLVGWLVAFAVAVRRSPLLAAGIGLMLLPLLIYSHIIPFGDIAAERFLYLPSAGACLVVAALLSAIPVPALRQTAIGCVVALLALRTFTHTPAWSSYPAFAELLSQAAPTSGVGAFTIGQRFHQEGFAQKLAMQEAQANMGPTRLRPEAIEAGLALAERHYREAARWLSLALERDPDLMSARLSLMQLLMEGPRQFPDQVIEHYRYLAANQFERIPSHSALWLRVANAHLIRGEYEQAHRLLMAARRGYVSNREAASRSHDVLEAMILYQWGAELFRAGRVRQGVLLTWQATDLDNRIDYLRNLAIMLEQGGDLGNALIKWGELARRQPTNPEFTAGVRRVEARIQQAQESPGTPTQPPAGEADPLPEISAPEAPAPALEAAPPQGDTP